MPEDLYISGEAHLDFSRKNIKFLHTNIEEDRYNGEECLCKECTKNFNTWKNIPNLFSPFFVMNKENSLKKIPSYF